MPAGSGRKGAPEWLEVTKLETTHRVKCDHCGDEISSKIERIRTHLKKCSKRALPSTSSSSIIDEVYNAKTNEDSRASNDLTNRFEVNEAPAPLSCKRQKLMSDFVMSTSATQKSDLDLKIAKFFYGNNIAFNAAASDSYKEMMQALRPGYFGPSRIDLAGNLLDQAASEVEEIMKIQICDRTQCSSFTLLIDGWSNIKNDPIIATCIHTGTNSFLLNAVDCEANSKTAEYCAKIANDSIEYCKNILGIEIFAICSDSENKMIKARDILQKRNDNLITYGCSAHYINLLAGEISKKDIFKHITEVQKFFRNHHQPHGWLKEKNGLMPQIPNVTRWNSQIACLDTFLKNYPKYLEIQAEKSNDIPLNINKILGNSMIYREATYMQKQLVVLESVLNKMQAESTNISDAVEYWFDLLENDILKPYETLIKNRMHQALHPFHYLANLMNPKYAGKRLTADMEVKAENWISERNAAWLVPMLAFKIKDAQIYPLSMFDEKVINHFTSTKWWNLMVLRSEGGTHKEFCQFIAGLINCTASSASIERVFSTCGLVWSKLRNSLGIMKAQKLVKVHQFLRQKP